MYPDNYPIKLNNLNKNLAGYLQFEMSLRIRRFIMFRLKITGMIFLLVAAFLLAGCASQPPIFNAQKLEEPQGYFTEEETIQCAKSKIEFIRQEGDLFLFYVEVESNAEDVLIIDPTEIYLEVVEDIDNQDKIYSERYFALDPEIEIMAINRMMREEEGRHDGATAGNIIFGVLNVVTDLASEREDKGEAVIGDVVEAGMSQVNEETYHSNTKEDLEASKDFWKNEVLNESVLNPGDTIGGLVYLPFSNTAKLFKVIIPVCNPPESHLYRQVQINRS
jgi:hypothetical protein